MSGFAAFYYILKKVFQFFLKIETMHNHIISLGFRFIKTKKHFLLFLVFITNK